MVSLSFKSKGECMYRLRDLKNGMFQIHARNGKAFEGTGDVIVEIAVKMGIVRAELEMARAEMTNNNHDFADFGIFGRLLYTSKDSKKAAA